ncbi:MAG TPA: biotin--[acetyl-CoA-carboxylase] ligase [Dehalococcoidia bacterium]|jgi:BirA family biotin operon repressor/biotin-[acetyl-CoA-carboxylase] ligase|nr:biotin--[acetyl-CoA-carboxylase] ligase [Dehalococcoidia bacterium]|tara:strand:+ start:212 stop:985 length:774 start_codon:yes stop_codon:yes gene_type:complete
MDPVSFIVKKGINTRIIGNKLKYFEIMSSTMDDVIQSGLNGENEGLTVVSENQTHGRGRTGNQWVSQEGNLLFSILLRPPSEIVNLLQPMIALSLQASIKRYCKLNVDIKWPNDLLINQSKIAGMLFESGTTAGKLEYVALGIGINVELQKVPQITATYPVTDLQTHTEFFVDRNELFSNIIHDLDTAYWDLKLGFDPIQRWKDELKIEGKMVSLNSNGIIITGLVLEVNDEGGLVVQCENDNIVTVMTGNLIERKH